MSTRLCTAKRSNGAISPIDAAAMLPKDLVRLRDWLQSHAHESIQLERLADIAGVKPRTLEAHCRQFLRTTPLAWVRRLRLMRARKALLDASSDASVTRIALDNGFTQSGRFAALYGRHFGEQPSNTLRRVRFTAPIEVDDEALLLTWSAMPQAFAVAPAQCDIALERLARAQERAPQFGLPKALAAWCLSQRAGQHFGSSPDEDLARGLLLCAEARSLAPLDPLVLTLVAGTLTLAHRLDEADQLLEQAAALDPWSPIVSLRRGWASAYHGDADAALCELRTTLQLMPFDAVRNLTYIGIGCAHFAAERYDRAACWVRAGIESSPSSFWAARILAAAAHRAGARTEARRVVKQLMRKDPHLTVSIARRAWPFPQSFTARLADALQAAGLPRN